MAFDLTSRFMEGHSLFGEGGTVSKYKLTEETKVVAGVTLYRIEALKSFGDVTEGDLGGWVQSEDNLSHIGNCWVSGDATVYGDAKVYENAQVYGKAKVFGNAEVYGDAWVLGDAQVFGNAHINKGTPSSGEHR